MLVRVLLGIFLVAILVSAMTSIHHAIVVDPKLNPNKYQLETVHWLSIKMLV